ncbi:MAG: hypothetical protein IJ291_00230 [Lachnospiraceae bacterium]|nr:hypothetical protein [Lachnospiraceae bacterium]
MPPSGRSRSSSRSRSSRRSSSGRSSRRSSSSRSSFSRHSSSSFRASAGARASHRTREAILKKYSTSSAGAFAIKNHRPRRTNAAFPGTGSFAGTRRFYHCYKHDYMYFDRDFMDENGVFRRQGYYDETGAYYENLNLQEYNKTKGYTCEYCGSSLIVNTETEGIKDVSCQSCGADIDFSKLIPLNEDYLVEETEDVMQMNTPVNQAGSVAGKFALIVFGVFMSIFLVQGIGMIVMSLFSVGSVFQTLSKAENVHITSNGGTVIVTEVNGDEVTMPAESVYIPEIGRDCDWSNEYQSYYDAHTGCYFVYNDDVDTPETQYWYEGFSDRYGDYGWMAYDESSQTWYVEVDYGEWEAVLDPPSYFWHTDVLEPN